MSSPFLIPSVGERPSPCCPGILSALRPVALPGAVCVLVAGDVEGPVQEVLDPPVASDVTGDQFHAPGTASRICVQLLEAALDGLEETGLIAL